MRIDFFRGINFLGGIEASVDIIGIGRVAYVDETGVLRALDKRFRDERLSAREHER